MRRKQGGEVNCPKCGAPELEGTQPADASSRFFKCGTVCDRGIVTTSWPCKELCELRSKLKPEGAEPLVFEDQNLKHFGKSVITNCCNGWMRISYSDDQAILIVRMDCNTKLSRFPTLEYAKAHAEELHQKAFAEFVEKWGKK